MKIIDSLISEITNEGDKLKYTYRLIKSTYKDGQAYGIEVEREDIKEGKTINIERDNIKLISNNKYKVRDLLNLLYKNQVSPIHLIEILGGYVDKYIDDFNNEENEIVIN